MFSVISLPSRTGLRDSLISPGPLACTRRPALTSSRRWFSADTSIRVEEGTNFQDYALYGCQWLADRFVAMTTYRVAEFIEDAA